MKLYALATVLILLTGCSFKNGHCYPALGLGWTTVSTNQPPMTRIETRIIGLGWLSKPWNRLVIGYGSLSVLGIGTNNVYVENK